MRQEERVIKYDETLKIEGYSFKGVMQEFPNHFHEHYVIGFIEKGQRHLLCKNREYHVGAGDLLLFNPGENHSCKQEGTEPLDYRCLNIEKEIMSKTVQEIKGLAFLPKFYNTVVFRDEQVEMLRELHQLIMNEKKEFQKEEMFYFLIEQLLEEHSQAESNDLSQTTKEIESVCNYISSHFTETITLDKLSMMAGLNKYTLLRSFTRQKGITPYQYLETVRVNKAKLLLEEGMEPIEVAMDAGFSDQSHFSKHFKKFIGISPRQYQNICKTKLRR